MRYSFRKSLSRKRTGFFELISILMLLFACAHLVSCGRGGNGGTSGSQAASTRVLSHPAPARTDAEKARILSTLKDELAKQLAAQPKHPSGPTFGYANKPNVVISTLD